MKHFLLVLLLPVFCMAAVYPVPMGTHGNQLFLAVQNHFEWCLKNVKVTVVSHPDWVEFENETAILDSIESQGLKEAGFQFQVFEGESGRTGEVVFQIFNDKEEPVTTCKLSFQAELNLQDSKLLSPFPNPANPEATIAFALKEPSHVNLALYNILGQRVRTLLDEERKAGLWHVHWDSRDDTGMTLASGVYVIRLMVRAKGKTRYWSEKLILKK